MFLGLAVPSFTATSSAAPVTETWQSFRDGSETVSARYTGASALGPNGEQLSALRLRYEGRKTEVDAHIGPTAIVKLSSKSASVLSELGARVVGPLMKSIDLWLVEDAAGADGLSLAVRLSSAEARARGVVSAAPDLYFRLKASADPFTPNDPRYSGQWYFDKLRMPEAWALSQGSANTRIVVVDSGCDLKHPDLASKWESGRDVVTGDEDPSFDLTQSGAAHGTAVSGIIAADTNNSLGIAGGCPECRLHCVRLLVDAPLPTSASVAAFDFALQVDAAIVSNSWGYVGAIPAPAALAAAVRNVFENGRSGKGALVLFAAGNDDREILDNELHALPEVLNVGAVNNFDDSTPFTNFGNSLDFVAPTGTLTTDISGPDGDDPGDYTNLFGGTSSSCPVAAGVAGLLVTVAPEKTSAELYQLMTETTRAAPFAVPDATGHDKVYGFGILDPVPALRKALGLPPITDGGVEAGVDGGADGGITKPPAKPASDEGGCGCRTAGAPASLSLAALIPPLLLLQRRRRRGRRERRRKQSE